MAGPVVSVREGRKGPTVMWRDQPDQRSFDIYFRSGLLP